MKIAKLEFIPASIPYTHREASSLVNRDGVTDVVVKASTDDGLLGWGESSSGANVESVLEALKAMAPFVIGRSPWESEVAAADGLFCLSRHRHGAVGHLRQGLWRASL